MRIGHREININSSDVVMYNGACWQVITRQVNSGKHFRCSPIMSKTQAEKMIKQGLLKFVKNADGLAYYKFNVIQSNLIEKCGEEGK